jgi:hypothetical protein
MRKRFYDVSPDGLKVIVAGYWSMEGTSDWGGGYPYGMREGNGFPVLYFVGGRGLVEYFRSYQEVSGIWSPDSRYYAYVERFIVEWGFEDPLKLLDVENWKRTEVGWCVPGRPDGPDYAFADGYLVWVTAEPAKGSAHPAITEDTLAPVLVGYDISTGKKFRVLEADMATLKKDKNRRQYDIDGNYYVVKMSPASSCPAVIKNSEIYKAYNGSYPRVINRDEFALYFW